MAGLLNINPEWEEKLERITRWAIKGLTPDEIIAKTGYDDNTVRKVLRDKRTKEAIGRVQGRILKAAFKDKVPILKNIVEMSLTAIKETLEELADPEQRKKMLANAKDLSSLAKVVTDLNSLLRLELGQTTENIETVSHTYQETKIVIEKLKEIDPVFDYDVTPNGK